MSIVYTARAFICCDAEWMHVGSELLSDLCTSCCIIDLVTIRVASNKYNQRNTPDHIIQASMLKFFWPVPEFFKVFSLLTSKNTFPPESVDDMVFTPQDKYQY